MKLRLLIFRTVLISCTMFSFTHLILNIQLYPKVWATIFTRIQFCQHTNRCFAGGGAQRGPVDISWPYWIPGPCHHIRCRILTRNPTHCYGLPRNLNAILTSLILTGYNKLFNAKIIVSIVIMIFCMNTCSLCT